MAGIGLILNTRAKRTAGDPELTDRLARALGDQGVVRTANSLDELHAACVELRSLGIDMLAIAGGDGTNHATLTCAVRAWEGDPLPYVALLRGGTMNTIANSFGIPRRRPESLLAIYKRLRARHALQPMPFVEPHLLRVGDRYGFIFGTGAIYGFIAEYNQRPERSPLWAARVLGTSIASAAIGGETIRRVAQRWEGEVRFADGTAFPERDYLTVGASTCGQIGLGFKPFYRNGEKPGHIHVLGIHCSATRFIGGLPRVWRGHPQGGERTYEKLCRAATLIPRHGEVPYTIDGDVYVQRGELEIACGPEIRIIIP